MLRKFMYREIEEAGLEPRSPDVLSEALFTQLRCLSHFWDSLHPETVSLFSFEFFGDLLEVGGEGGKDTGPGVGTWRLPYLLNLWPLENHSACLYLCFFFICKVRIIETGLLTLQSWPWLGVTLNYAVAAFKWDQTSKHVVNTVMC